ncbi:MAG: NfeD family protein [Clostridia bacterium]|nr:NfeD family protein [Clostridia bacterium]
MSFVEWWNALGLVAQIFYCIAIPATLVLVIQTILMLFGFDDGEADADFDADIDADTNLDFDADVDAEIPDDIDFADANVTDGVYGDEIADAAELADVAGFDSLRLFTVRGIVAFLVMFGWVGVVMTEAEINLVITLLVATVCGFAIMVLVAYLFKAIMRLRSNGTADNRNALGGAGRVYLTIPASRKGEGKVNVMLQGSYVERNAVTDESEAIPTGSEIIVVGVSGQTTLIVKRK